MQFRISISRSLVFIFCVSAIIVACKSSKNKISNIPFLELRGAYVYNNGNGKDSFVLVSLFYQDGDGNIGLEPSDTFPPFGPADPYFYNLKVWMLEKKSGKWIRPVNPLSPTKDTVDFNERIKNITPTGRIKWVEGNLDIRIPAEPFSLKPDTIKIQVQLFDRALNKSALVETEEIILQH